MTVKSKKSGSVIVNEVESSSKKVKVKVKVPDSGVVNGIQLNIVSIIDYKKANVNQSLKGAIHLTDNSFKSKNKGTPLLETVCTQGQVINWLVYPTDLGDPINFMEYNPSVRISNIVFIDENGEVFQQKICEDLKTYGSLDKAYPFLKPTVYYYWAGVVKADLPVGTYRYRLIFELDNFTSSTIKSYLDLDSASLKVVALNDDISTS